MIIAYHGSPYDFTSFNPNRLGSGEGNERYGDGVYLAENPAVAEFYADEMKGEAASGESNIYKVQANVDPSRLLDWDRPLDAQLPAVKTALQSLASAGVDAKTPQNVLEQLPGSSGQQTMLAHGIEGVRYLDQGSRAKGEGTRNYVIFDPKALTIVAKNGQPLANADDDAQAQGASPSPLAAIAFHEAGHAVAAVELGFEPVSASIIPADGSRGRVLYRAEDRFDPNVAAAGADSATRKGGEEAIIVCLAGAAAERRFNPDASPSLARSDREMAEDLALALNGGDKDLAAGHLGYLELRADFPRRIPLAHDRGAGEHAYVEGCARRSLGRHRIGEELKRAPVNKGGGDHRLTPKAGASTIAEQVGSAQRGVRLKEGRGLNRVSPSGTITLESNLTVKLVGCDKVHHLGNSPSPIGGVK